VSSTTLVDKIKETIPQKCEGNKLIGYKQRKDRKLS